MTRNEAINKIIWHLDNDLLGATNGKSCLYRDGPKRCAVGALLDDATYNEISDANLINSPVTNLYDYGITFDDIFTVTELELLQAAHDSWALNRRTDWVSSNNPAYGMRIKSKQQLRDYFLTFKTDE